MKTRWTILGASVAMLAQAGFVSAATSTERPAPIQYQYQNQNDVRARISDRQIQSIIARIRTDAASLLANLDQNAPRGRAYGNRARRAGDTVSYMVDDLIVAADHLADHLTRRVVIRADVDDLLARAQQIDTAMQRQTASGAAQTSWVRLRRDIDELASGYNVVPNWRTGDYGYTNNVPGYERLTGTYALDATRSDNARRAADRVLGQVPANQRARVAEQIYARLEAPETLSIDRQGNRVTIASSRAPQMTLTADGQPRTDSAAGRNITTRASMYGDRLEVNANGVNGADFAATFEPLDNGQSLRLTRTIYDDALRQPVVVQSTYRRTSESPQWNVYDSTTASNSRYDSTYNPANRRTAGAYNVPAGTQLVATLDQTVSSRTSRQNDRVTLTIVNAPQPELQGAVIQGYLVDTPSMSNGRTGLNIDFNQIQLRNGQTIDFVGTVQSVRGANGQAVVFDADQPANRDSQRDQAIQRGAIGAAVGAIIGAVVGGGKGAVAGAVLGGGGAAATVFLPQNQNELPRGTEFTIRAGGY